MSITQELSNSTPKNISENENICIKLKHNAHRSITNPKLETIQVSNNLIYVYMNCGVFMQWILLNNEKKFKIWYMLPSEWIEKHYDKWKMADPQDYILYDPIYVKCKQCKLI
jgi:hypothetical protein